MKKIILILSAVALLSSCEDMFGSFLDKAPSAELTEQQVFSDWKRTEYFHNDIYNFLRNGLARVNSSWLDAASDLGKNTTGGVTTSFNLGNYYDNGAYNEVVDSWRHFYLGIRKVNIFLTKVDQVPLGVDESQVVRDAKVKRMKAEARFFRAYFYWELALRYGPIPVIEEALDPFDPSVKTLQRPASVNVVTDYVLSELNAVYNDLTDDGQLDVSYMGRITKGIDLALQSRITLYLASPQYNTTGDAAKWVTAKDKALQFINTFGHLSGSPKYKLYSVSGSLPGVSYQLAINRRAYDGNTEAIFWRNDAKADWWMSDSPVSFGGTGGLCPSQNLVDMYDMANGSAPFTGYDETGAPVYSADGTPTVNIASGYSEQNPYANRDPRFAASVLYNGSTWWNETIDTYEGGKDKPKGNVNATQTGYYNKKYHDDSQTHYLNGGTMYRNWIFIRYAEILLNYAEALNETQATPSADVYNVLQMLRDRAGISGNLQTDRPMTKDQMRNFIRKERAVELSFEEQRWWDVRRWKVAEKALNRPIYGMKIVKGNNALSFSRVKVSDRYFQGKMYLYPIPEAQIWMTGMQNNPGW